MACELCRPVSGRSWPSRSLPSVLMAAALLRGLICSQWSLGQGSCTDAAGGGADHGGGPWSSDGLKLMNRLR